MAVDSGFLGIGLKMSKCSHCSQDIELVADEHEKHGHNINHGYRSDLIPDDTLCEDCKDDVLEDLLAK